MAQIATPVTISFAAFGGSGSGGLDKSGRKDASTDPRSTTKGQATGNGNNVITWPSTPKIAQSIEVNYQMWELQHTNYQPAAFGNRATPTVTISGQWFSRDATEATKTINAIHLLRSATSMYYGREDSKRGTPPPVGRLNAHGFYANTPVVIKSFQYDFPNDVDYITASVIGGGTQSIPVLFEMSVSLIVQVNLVETVKNYTLDKFFSGDLLADGYI